MEPPRPERRPTVIAAHGDQRVDDWYWLKDRSDPAVLAHLEAERAYADAALAPLETLKGELFDEIKSRVAETDLSVPVKHGPWWYYERTEEGKDYALHCRRPVSGTEPPLDAAATPDEIVLLDENALAEGHEYLRVANLSVNPSHDRLAYGTDTSGAELYDLRFLALEPGLADAPETVPETYYGLAWATDSAAVLYTRVDAAMRPYQVWRHALGSDPAGDQLVFQEDDERFTVSVGKSKDGELLLIACMSSTTSEWWAVPAADPGAAPQVVWPRRHGVEYSVEHHHGAFVVLTNDEAEDFRVLAVEVGGGETVEILSHRPGTRVDDVDVFDRWLVVAERLEGDATLRIVEIPDAGVAALAGGDVVATSWLVPTEDRPSGTWEGWNPEPDATSLRVEQTSLVQPRTVSDVDLSTGEVTVRKRQPVLGGYDPEEYRTARLWATAPDGVRVPISIVHRADVASPAPCLVYGYGAYEVSCDPVFSPRRLPLLDRGVVYAIAHVRGGGELGRRWYLDGKLAAKEHTVTDFIACARHLVDSGLTVPGRLAARGRSAGGLLMGAIVNRAPELFAAVVAEVPFVDCLTTMLDESLPLTVGEFEEWGDPVRDAAAYLTIKGYSPYDNVGPGPHPRILATGALHDPRVGYWEPAKWAAKLRDLEPQAAVVFRPELSAGHGGPSGRYDAWRDEALLYAFVLDAVGLGTGAGDPDLAAEAGAGSLGSGAASALGGVTRGRVSP
ncbi:MAG: S9 family peptidase [Acidimicrobiales bacterium]